MRRGAWFVTRLQASQAWEKGPNKTVNSVCATNQQERREKNWPNAKNSLTAEHANCYKLCLFLDQPQNVVFLVKFSQSTALMEIVSLELPKSGKIGI